MNSSLFCLALLFSMCWQYINCVIDLSLSVSEDKRFENPIIIICVPTEQKLCYGDIYSLSLIALDFSGVVSRNDSVFLWKLCEVHDTNSAKQFPGKVCTAIVF